jgi:CubicO group peptidase (beta-lactamase class C family)
MLAFRYTHQGASTTPEDYMARNRVSGWLVLKNGEIASERYAMGNNEGSRWISFSLAKSVTATLVGAALHDGSLDSLDRRCETILPALRGGGYEGTTVRQLLRMSSGVRWSEAYQDTSSDIYRFGEAAALGRPGAVLEFMAGRPRAATPGTRFNYNTGETYVLGALVAAVTGTNLSQYFAERVWSRTGMEADGYWMLDAPGGQELAGSGFSATLRDYGRLALLILNDGVVDGQRLLPEGWRDLAGYPDTPLTAPYAAVGGYPLGYGYQWWSLPSLPAFTGQGVYGQFMYLHPAENFASIVWGAWSQSNSSAIEFETYSLLAGAVEWLR